MLGNKRLYEEKKSNEVMEKTKEKAIRLRLIKELMELIDYEPKKKPMKQPTSAK